jgi:alkylated DNA repair dioxygenase AlkB
MDGIVDSPPAWCQSGTPVEHDLGDGSVSLWPAAFDEPAANELLAELLRTIEWQQESLLIFGKCRAVPRLVAWHGDSAAIYTYSGMRHVPLPWTPALTRVRRRVTSLSGCEFNSVLANRYRGGQDAMGWHADDEPELGTEPVIASVSLGATRRFRLRHRVRRHETHSFDLPHGSLLVMSGPIQRCWMHCLARTSRPVGERINLTFRRVLTERPPSAC